MIARPVCIVAFALVSIACAAPAQANWLTDFCHSIARDVKRRQCWPKPFICPDRYAIQAPFALMVSNGWRQQNMLSDHHFTENSGDLTEAGQLKVRWILTEAPQQHRTIYVRRARSPEETGARLDNVRQLAANIVPPGMLPPVLETSVPAHGWSAAQVDEIGRKFQKSIPDPKLPEAIGGEETK